MDGPAPLPLKTVQVEGPGGRMVINETDLLEYEGKGYNLVEEDPDNPHDPVKKATSGEPPTYNFGKHKNADLIQFAKDAGIPHEGVVRTKLIEALTAAKFDPTPAKE